MCLISDAAILKMVQELSSPALCPLCLVHCPGFQNYSDLRDAVTVVELPKLRFLLRDLSKQQRDFSIEMLMFVFLFCFVLLPFLTFRFTCKNIVRIAFL